MTQEHLDLHLYLNKEENSQPKKEKKPQQPWHIPTSQHPLHSRVF